MGVEAKFTEADVQNYFHRCMTIIREEIIRAMTYLGEQCVRIIRNRSASESWIDQTGNLRSSIGYAVYDYGVKLMQSTFKQVMKGAEGASVGQRIVEELASKYSDTYALVVIAGMNYAEFVERINGKDVLASTELWARVKADGYLKSAVRKAINRINKAA